MLKSAGWRNSKSISVKPLLQLASRPGPVEAQSSVCAGLSGQPLLFTSHLSPCFPLVVCVNASPAWCRPHVGLGAGQLVMTCACGLAYQQMSMHTCFSCHLHDLYAINIAIMLAMYVKPHLAAAPQFSLASSVHFCLHCMVPWFSRDNKIRECSCVRVQVGNACWDKQCQLPAAPSVVRL